jgi:hypothetical protein
LQAQVGGDTLHEHLCGIEGVGALAKIFSGLEIIRLLSLELSKRLVTLHIVVNYVVVLSIDPTLIFTILTRRDWYIISRKLFKVLRCSHSLEPFTFFFPKPFTSFRRIRRTSRNI